MTNERQITDIAPYRKYIDPSMDTHTFWRECNDHGWFDIRRKIIDQRMMFDNTLWDRSRALNSLTEMLSDNGKRYWLDRWIDDWLASDTTWAEIRAVLKEWLDNHTSLEALKIVASSVVHAGSRTDFADS